MPMPAASAIAALIVADLQAAGASAGPNAVDPVTAWTKIVQQIQTMIEAGTVTVAVPSLGLVAPNGPVTGAATGTGSLA